MAYNRRNFLLTVLDVQTIVLEKQKLGITNTRIFEDYIKNRFRISKRTFDEYLGINAKKKLKDLDNNIEEEEIVDPNQVSMYDIENFDRNKTE